MNIKNDNLYTTDEVAEYLKIGYRNVLNLIHQKEIVAVKIGNIYRISGYALNTFIKENYF